MPPDRESALRRSFRKTGRFATPVILARVDHACASRDLSPIPMTSIQKFIGSGSERGQLPVDHGKGPPLRGPEQVPEPGEERRKTIIKRVAIVLVVAMIVLLIWGAVSAAQDKNSRQQNAEATSEARRATREAGG